MLGEVIPGEIHLSFLTHGDGEVRFSSDLDERTRGFLTSTLGAAASHPLIYQTHGEIAAISDAISSRQWSNRAMYRHARPYVRMDDALGTDLKLKTASILSTCAIRESRTFRKEERDLYRLMIPHFRSVLEIREINGHLGTDVFRIFPFDQLPLSQLALRENFIRWMGETFPAIPAKSMVTLATNCARWLFQRGSSTSPLLQRLDLEEIWGKCSLIFIPATSCQSGAAVIYIQPRKGMNDGVSLTPRERQVASWLCEGKTNAEIALILGISAGTIKRHLENIYDKLHVPNRTSAILKLVPLFSKEAKPKGV